MSATLPTVVTAAPDRRHFYWIDWLRFMAAFFVLFDHACKMNWSGPGLIPGEGSEFFIRLLVMPTHLGQPAVIVFFVLSGALVGGLTLEKIRAGTFDAAAYTADRLARLYVPLIPALLLSIAVLRLHDLRVSPLDFAGCLFGLQGVLTRVPMANGVLWTLAYEVWFYALAGCAAVAVGKHRPAGVRAAALAGGAWSLWVLCFRLNWINLACWLVGAFGFGLCHRIAPRARAWTAAAGLAIMGTSLAGVWTDLLPLLPADWTISREPWKGKCACATLAAGTLLFMAGACQLAPKTRIGASLERLGTAPAAFSYTLYLTHYPLVLLLLWIGDELPMVITWPSLWRLGWWMAVCVGVAFAMYAIFERQTPRVRRWLRARLGNGLARRIPAVGRQPPLAAEA